MNRWLDKVLWAASLVAVAGGPTWATAAENRDVRVINTPAEAVPVTLQGTAAPVPVTGSVTVAGNSAATPLFVRPALPQPLSKTVFGTLVSAGGYYLENFEYTVPAGKQAVITHVGMTVRIATATGGRVALEYKYGTGAATTEQTEVTMNPKKFESLVFMGYEDWVDTHFPQIYLSAGTTFRATAYSDTSGSGQLYLSGYLVDAP